MLKLTVYDVDRHKRHQVIGHALYPLREHDCENNERLVIWRDLEKEVSEVMADLLIFLLSIFYCNLFIIHMSDSGVLVRLYVLLVPVTPLNRDL